MTQEYENWVLMSSHKIKKPKNRTKILAIGRSKRTQKEHGKHKKAI
jgi:hypothetical protein